MTVTIRMNPNFKADVLKAAEEKLNAKILTEKQVLEKLNRGERIGNRVLAHLAAKGLIEVREVTNHDTPRDEQEFLFICITERGKEVLES